MQAAAVPAWSLPARIAFRFFFVYWLLYALPFPCGSLPFSEPAVEAFTAVEQVVVPWVGEHLLRLPEPITYFPSGSGDKTSDYVKNLLVLAVAAGAALVWTLLDRRQSHPLLLDLLRIYVRYNLAATMLSYGGYKVVPMQFPTPGLDRLLQPYGDSSPMGLLWTFMGASAAYTCFAGAGEVLGGLLLCFRRTTTLGALVSAGVMANVVAMNFSYDVPVKLFSTNLLLMALFLAAPDLGRLANVLLLNRPTAPRDLGPPWKGIPWLRWPLLAVKLFFVGWLLYAHVGTSVHQHLADQLGWESDDPRTRSELFGCYVVEEFKRNGALQPPLTSDGWQWRRLILNEFIFGGKGTGSLRLMDDRLLRCFVEIDLKGGTVSLTPRDDLKKKWTFAFARPATDLLTLTGEMEGEKLEVRLKRVPPPPFLLMNRGFHWVQEMPFNR